VEEKIGFYAQLVDDGQVIGAALKTKLGTKPIYVSVGHKISLSSAIKWVLNCCRGYRLPEPTRLAHLAAGGNLRIEPGQQGKLFD
jgi:deoxyribonuclease V